MIRSYTMSSVQKVRSVCTEMFFSKMYIISSTYIQSPERLIVNTDHYYRSIIKYNGLESKRQ